MKGKAAGSAAVCLPRGAGGGPSSLDEVRERQVEGPRDSEQVVHQCSLVALFDPVDGLPVHPRQLGKLFL